MEKRFLVRMSYSEPWEMVPRDGGGHPISDARIRVKDEGDRLTFTFATPEQAAFLAKALRQCADELEEGIR